MAHSTLDRLWLVSVAIVFHFLYITIVFDCHFPSTISSGEYPQHALQNPPAKRLVLVVADGLRADLLFAKSAFPTLPQAPHLVAPYLRSVVEHRGAFGISHTGIPTESRHGHAAILAGLYEDVSGMTKGWNGEPVNFDTVFNQSTSTFAFGSSDILSMFAHTESPGKVGTWGYSEIQTDSERDATALDTWVMDHLRNLFQNATTNSTLDARLRRDKTFFFLHLGGLDTAGHFHRPHSKEYMRGIQVVDDIVEQTEQLFNEFYADSESAFVFTADHGMSRIGTHGDGHPDNAYTPLIAWGKGVRGPLPDSTPSSHDAYSEPWGLSHLLRVDVAQVDVCVLLASLVGVNMPVNSVGVLPGLEPAKPGYLRDEETQVRAGLVNAKVLLEQYRIRHLDSATSSIFNEQYFSTVKRVQDRGAASDSELSVIQELIAENMLLEARLRTKRFIENTLDSLQHLQRYEQLTIRGIAIAAYLGWMGLVLVSTLLPPSSTRPTHIGSQNYLIHVLAIVILVFLWARFAAQRVPTSYYYHAIFPCYFWDQTVSRALAIDLPILVNELSSAWICTLFRTVVTLVAMQVMVRGYKYPGIWSAFLVASAMWPLFRWSRELILRRRRLLSASITCTLVTAVFPLLGNHPEESLATISMGGVAMFAVGVAGYYTIEYRDPQERARFRTVTALLLGLGMIFMNFVGRTLSARNPVPRAFRFIGWGTFVLATITPFVLRVPSSNPHGRLLSFFLGPGIVFVWLSIRTEGLFYTAYSLTVYLWAEVEAALRSHEQNTATRGPASRSCIRWDDVRIAVFFLYFVQIAFFGAGNAFYLAPVYRLVPTFNIRLMTRLLLLKTATPYVVFGIALSILNARLGLPRFRFLALALGIADVATLSFFLDVSNTASWQEIGRTVSAFCISSSLLVCAAGTGAIGELVTAGQPRGSTNHPSGEGEHQGRNAEH
ncbi:alkaline phosphatase-like protein [Trametes elegans]|nr:alkaline phosphatase-like protein [Trametes elegans]